MFWPLVVLVAGPCVVLIVLIVVVACRPAAADAIAKSLRAIADPLEAITRGRKTGPRTPDRT